MKSFEELYNQLPSSWNTLSLGDYQKINAINNEGHIEDTIFHYLSALTNATVDELQDLPIVDLNKLIAKIKFITNSVPTIKDKSILEWKKLDEVKFNDFVTYEKLCKDENSSIQNLHFIVKAYLKKDLPMDEILALNVEEVFTGFFLLQKHTKKFLADMKFYLRLSLLKQKMKNIARLQKTEKK